MSLDPEVQGELTRVAAGIVGKGAEALLTEVIERRAGKRLAAMNAAEAIEAIRQHEAERTFETTDELVPRGAAQAGAGEPDEEDGA